MKRTRFLTNAAAALLAGLAASHAPHALAQDGQDKPVAVSTGGAVYDRSRESLFEPFTAETDVDVEHVAAFTYGHFVEPAPAGRRLLGDTETADIVGCGPARTDRYRCGYRCGR